MKREIERFIAKGTSGRSYTVVRYAQQVVHRPLDGPVEYLDGAHSLALSDGRHVNEIEPGRRYQIFDTEELIER